MADSPTSQPELVLRARYVLPVDRPPIENGCVHIAAGVVAAIQKHRRAGLAERDLGDVALLPGFVNAHTHLELTRLHSRVPFSGSFAAWIESLLSQTQAATDEQTARESIRRGVRESLAAGVTTVGDIGHGRHPFDELARGSMRAVCFVETLGIGRTAQSALRRLEAAIDERACVPRKTWAGISPHAPYSTAREVYVRCVKLAASQGWRLCTHLGESREELQFLADGTGPLRELLDRRQLLDASFEPLRTSPVAFARSVGLLDHPTLLAHVNYATDEELDTLARSRCSVAYCPRSHRYFRHEPHRFRDMLARGINVCAATDSLASNDSLCVLDELRFLRQEHPDLRPNTLIEMGTSRGAAALGLDSLVGTLAAGKLADLVAIPLDPCPVREVAEQVLTSKGRVACVYVGGQLIEGLDAL